MHSPVLVLCAVVDVFHEETLHGQEPFRTRAVGYRDWTGQLKEFSFSIALVLFTLCAFVVVVLHFLLVVT